MALKTWKDDRVTIIKLDTLEEEGYQALRGTFEVEGTNVFEIMNLIIDVDGYDWVEGESKSEMLYISQRDTSFTFDFFVDIPWFFIKKTGRARVDITYTDGVFTTKSTQLKDYQPRKGYDIVDFYSAQWQLEPINTRDVKVTYLGVYKDVKMLINLNSFIINRIRKRLNATFHNLIDLTKNKPKPAQVMVWPKV